MSLRRIWLPLLSLMVATSALATPAFAADAPADPYADALLGNWGGVRTQLSDAGVDATVYYKGDLWNVASGGTHAGSGYMDNLDVQFALDGEKLWGISGNKAYISFLNNNGAKVNANRVGSVEGMDNIETGTNTAKLYEAWMEQSFFNDQVAVLVGLRDLNAEFAVTDMSGNFIKPTMQVMQSLAQSGQNGPDVFPNTGLATRVRYNPTTESYVSVAAFDGVPGEPNQPHGTQIGLSTTEGALLIAEAGITPGATDDGAPNKFALGAWTYTRGVDDLVDTSGGQPVKRRQAGAYLLSSYQFYKDGDGRTVGAFVRGGVADGNTAQVNWDYETGIVGNGWVPTRPDSEIGLGFTQAHNDSKYVQSVGGANGSEYGMEAYYRDTVAPGVSLQPDLQYIINPGSDQATGNAAIVGIRLGINL